MTVHWSNGGLSCSLALDDVADHEFFERAPMERLAAKYEGAVDVVKVDVDANPGLSQAFGIMSIPTIAFFKGAGTQPLGAVGFQTAEQLEARFGLKEIAAAK